MAWLHLVIIIFTALTVLFTYINYRSNNMTKQAFTIIALMEFLVIIMEIPAFVYALF